MDRVHERMRLVTYLRPELATAVDLAAQDEGRTVSQQVAWVLEEWLFRRGGKAARPVRCGACGTWRDATVGACSVCAERDRRVAALADETFAPPPAEQTCPGCAIPSASLDREWGLCPECAAERRARADPANGGG